MACRALKVPALPLDLVHRGPHVFVPLHLAGRHLVREVLLVLELLDAIYYLLDLDLRLALVIAVAVFQGEEELRFRGDEVP